MLSTIKLTNIEEFKQLLLSPKKKEVLDVDSAIFTSEAKQRFSIGTVYLGMEGGGIFGLKSKRKQFSENTLKILSKNALYFLKYFFDYIRTT
jgi:hypothetical protein